MDDERKCVCVSAAMSGVACTLHDDDGDARASAAVSASVSAAIPEIVCCLGDVDGDTGAGNPPVLSDGARCVRDDDNIPVSSVLCANVS